MNARIRLGSFLLGLHLLVACGGALSEEPQPPAPPPPPPPPTSEPEPYTQASPNGPAEATSQPPPAPPPPAATPTASAAPGQTPLVQSYPTGQWVYLPGQGWVWVPSGATAVEDEGVPYVYLYTPAYGWTWYVSPWGWGPYHYGVWTGHPWHPVGLHGYWVAHPRAAGHLGRGRR